MKLRYYVFSALIIFASINGIAFGTSDSQSMNYTAALATSRPIYDPSGNAMLSLLVTSAFIGGTLLFTHKIIQHKKNSSDHPNHGLWSILKTTDSWYSLASLQFFVWTIVISFAFMFVYMFRIFSGVLDLYSADLPANLLGLMGVSAGAAIASRSIGTSKEKPEDQMTAEEKKNQQKIKQWRDDHKPLKQSMFYGAGQTVTLSRLQMFLWTVMSIVIYIAIFSSIINNTLVHLYDIEMQTNEKIQDLNQANKESQTTLVEQMEKEQAKLVRALRVPDIDQVMLVLMGISQVSYLGVKKAEQK